MNRKNIAVWIIGIASAIAFLFAAFATTAASAAPAARHLPKIQTAPLGWHSSSWKVRPSAVYFGGGRPALAHLAAICHGSATATAPRTPGARSGSTTLFQPAGADTGPAPCCISTGCTPIVVPAGTSATPGCTTGHIMEKRSRMWARVAGSSS